MHTVKKQKSYGLNLERELKETLKASRKRTDKLLRKAQNLGMADIYMDNDGRIRRKKES